MEKTFRFLSMAALLVVGAIMTGCSSDDNMDIPQQPANKDNVVTLTATVSLDGGDGMRAVDGSTGVKTFESTNKIAVVYKNASDETMVAESGALTLSADKKTATFTVTLTNPANNSAIRYIYPATMAKTPATDATITDDDATIDYSGLFGSQDGTLATIGTNYDLAVFDGSLSGTNLPTSTTLTNKLAICKFKLKDTTPPITDITSTVNSLTVSDGTNTYAISPSGLSEIYVAMKPVTGKSIAFTASTSASKTYFKTSGIKTLAASKLYTDISVAMVELAVGKVIGKDGIIYNDAAEAGAQAAAIIAYLGSDTYDATFKNGLAIALADESGTMDWSTAMSTCGAKTAITGAKWCLPSQEQWLKMFKANGGDDTSYTGLNTTITTAGGTTLQAGDYWSSTEWNLGSDALYVYLVSGASIYSKSKDNNCRVRACLAF